MKKFLLPSLLILGASAAFAEDVPAFPGAEGHGRYVTGGRGGVIRHVTNLNDSGDGSLRSAVNGSTKKIVVFDVSGEIALKSNLNIGANTTILGQTAPGEGITVRYYTVEPKNNNIIIRFMRFRRGQEMDVDDGADAIWTRQRTGIIIDHCSMSWSIDEVASFYDNNNFTMQWCTIAECLNNAGHGKGAHGYGGIWGGKLASFHHNMLAHLSNRGPRFNGGRYEWTGYTSNKLYSQYKWQTPALAENVDFRNCVQYNANGSCYGGPGGGQINMVNNYYKQGPSGNGSYNRITLVTVGAAGNSSGHPDTYGMTSRYYISGNSVSTSGGTVTKDRDWKGVEYDSGTYTDANGVHWSKDPNNLYGDGVEHKTFSGNSCVCIKLDEEAPKGEVTTHSAEEAYKKVLEYVGASYVRDVHDARYVEEAKKGTATYTGSVTKKKGLIDVVADIKDYPKPEELVRPADWDTDKDGIPDEWEKAYGLDPTVNDANKYTLDTRGWYTNIEVYANSLVEHIMKGGNEDAIETVDEYYPVLPQSSLTTVTPSSTVERFEYYNLHGVRLEEPAPGINIRRIIMTDGRVITDKIIK